MSAASPAPRKRTAPRKTAAPAKRPPAKKATPAAAPAGASAPAGPPAVELSVNQWLHELQATPLRVEVFDRWWEFKLPTGARAVAWDVLIGTKGIRGALSSMMLDQTASPEVRIPRADGSELVIEAIPGSAKADEFIAVANEWVHPEAAEEFWARIERAIFGPGEASASS